jgi:hypothetical protein
MTIFQLLTRPQRQAITTAILTAALLFSGVTSPAGAALFSGDLICSTSGTVQVVDDVVTGNLACKGSVEIPASVTSIAAAAFKGNSVEPTNNFDLTGITFAAGSALTSIGDEAFMQARALKAIEIPAGVTSIGAKAFMSTGALASVTFAPSSALTSIGRMSFNEATALNNFTLPAGVTRIEQNAFQLTSSLTNFTFATGSSLNFIGAAAFHESSITSFTVPSGVTHIEVQAFRGASQLQTVIFLGNAPIAQYIEVAGATSAIAANNSFSGIHAGAIARVGAGATGFPATDHLWNTYLRVQHDGDVLCGTSGFFTLTRTTVTSNTDCVGSVTIPASATHVGDRAFKNNTSIDSLDLEPSSVLQAIGIEAFAGATNLGSATIPATVTSIADQAFQGDVKLRDLNLSGVHLASIGNFAFEGTALLSAIVFPSSVEVLGEDSFMNSALTSIKFLGQTPMTPLLSPFRGSPATRVFVPEGPTDAVVSSWDATEYDFGVSGSTWKGLSVIKSPDVACSESGFVTITTDVTDPTIETVISATSCQGSVEIPATVTAFNVAAFNEVVGLTAVTFAPDSAITKIADSTFINSGLTSIVLPDGLTSIENMAFAGTASLTSITIPASVTSIGERAFEGSHINSIRFAPEGALSSIGAYAFRNARQLEGIEIPASVTYIGVRPFSSNFLVTAFSVAAGNPNYVAVGGVLFNSAQNTLIAYPIGSGAPSYEVPSSVIEIGQDAFYNSQNLRQIVFTGNAPSAGSATFYGMHAGTTAKVTASATGFTLTAGLWYLLVIDRAVAPGSGSSSGGDYSPVPSPSPTPIVSPTPTPTPTPTSTPILEPGGFKTLVRQLALSQVVENILPSGTPRLKGVTASKFVAFENGSIKLDAADLGLIKAVAKRFAGKPGILAVVGFARYSATDISGARKIALSRAKAVTGVLAKLAVLKNVGFAAYGARSKRSPSASDSRVELRWLPAK